MSDIFVRKLDSEIEPFSFDKLLASIGKVGIKIDKAIEITTEVEKWIKSRDSKNHVTTAEIRDKLIEIMGVEFPTETDIYKTYKK